MFNVVFGTSVARAVGAKPGYLFEVQFYMKNSEKRDIRQTHQQSRATFF